MDTIGKRLARARKESGMSQPELARVVEALARALGVSVRWLVDGDGPREQVGAWPFSQVERSAIEALSPSQKAAVERCDIACAGTNGRIWERPRGLTHVPKLYLIETKPPPTRINPCIVGERER